MYTVSQPHDIKNKLMYDTFFGHWHTQYYTHTIFQVYCQAAHCWQETWRSTWCACFLSLCVLFLDLCFKFSSFVTCVILHHVISYDSQAGEINPASFLFFFQGIPYHKDRATFFLSLIRMTYVRTYITNCIYCMYCSYLHIGMFRITSCT